MSNSSSTPTTYAPVALFAFKRPEHLRRTIKSLAANAEANRTDLHVFCDAARRPDDEAAVRAVRDLVRRIDGFRSVQMVARKQNLGLARSIIDGVAQILEANGRVIVVEDDLLLSPHFLRYMNDGLNLYEGERQVASLHGYCFPVADVLPETFFVRGADCWGWATWSRAWAHFEPDGHLLLERLRREHLTHAFDINGSYPFTRMLEDQAAGRNDSWAIRWHAACFLRGDLTLYPGHTLVMNIGNDASGTHSAAAERYNAVPSAHPVAVRPIPVVASAEAMTAFERFHRSSPGLLGRAKQLVKRALARTK